MSNSYSMSELLSSFEEELESQKEDILSGEYPEDIIDEIADSHIPVYNYDLAMYLANNLTLGFPEDDPGDHEDVFSMIKWSIYKDLVSEGYEVLERWREESGDDEEDEGNEEIEIEDED